MEEEHGEVLERIMAGEEERPLPPKDVQWKRTKLVSPGSRHSHHPFPVGHISVFHRRRYGDHHSATLAVRERICARSSARIAYGNTCSWRCRWWRKFRGDSGAITNANSRATCHHRTSGRCGAGGLFGLPRCVQLHLPGPT